MKSESTGTAEMEAQTTSSQTQESVPTETQYVEEDNLQTVDNSGEERHKDAKMVEAQTQTRKQKGTNRCTQTPVVRQSTQETQTDFDVPKQDDTPKKTETHNAAETQPEQDKPTPETTPQDAAQTQNENPDSERTSSDSAKKRKPEKESKEKNPSAGDSQGEEGANLKSYAKAVSGEGTSQKQPSVEASKAADKTTKTPQSTR